MGESLGREFRPAICFAGHEALPDDAELRLAPPNQPCCDVEIRSSEVVHRLEVTVADLYWHHPELKANSRSANPGTQRAWMNSKLSTDGWVDPSSPLIPVRRDGKVSYEYLDETAAHSDEDVLEACRRGLRIALQGKDRDNGYGSGGSLLIYCRDFSSTFMTADVQHFFRLMAPFVSRMPLASFDTVFVISRHEGWISRYHR